MSLQVPRPPFRKKFDTKPGVANSRPLRHSGWSLVGRLSIVKNWWLLGDDDYLLEDLEAEEVTMDGCGRKSWRKSWIEFYGT